MRDSSAYAFFRSRFCGRLHDELTGVVCGLGVSRKFPFAPTRTHERHALALPHALGSSAVVGFAHGLTRDESTEFVWRPSTLASVAHCAQMCFTRHDLLLGSCGTTGTTRNDIDALFDINDTGFLTSDRAVARGNCAPLEADPVRTGGASRTGRPGHDQKADLCRGRRLP